MKTMETSREKTMFENVKATHDAIILFRNGDFYECYETDADFMAKELNLTLTTRNNVRMCAFPHASLDFYLTKILRTGNRACIV